MTAVHTTESDASASAFRTASPIYRKTAAGYAELQQRTSTRIALRTRWTLVMIDGKTPASSMIERLGGVGIDETVFTELVSHGLIESLPPAAGPIGLNGLDGPALGGPACAPAPAGSIRPATLSGRPASSPKPESPGPLGSSLTTHRVTSPVGVVHPSADTKHDTGANADASNELRRQAELYAFFCSTIRDLIGLRGMFLQLAVERAGSLDDYRALKERYLAAVMRAKGSTVAAALRARLDTLLDHQTENQ